MEKIINTAEENVLHTYNRFKVVFDHGEGVYLYDKNGKKYLDFASGIGVMALGYGNEQYTSALKNQIDKLMHTSNLYYTEPLADAAKKLCKVSGMDRVFFTNSGAEGIEGAIKSARKYAFNKDGKHETAWWCQCSCGSDPFVSLGYNESFFPWTYNGIIGCYRKSSLSGSFSSFNRWNQICRFQ